MVADPTRRPEWQHAVEAVEVTRAVPSGVGTRMRERRRVAGTTRTLGFEVTEYEPGSRYCYAGIDGPVRVRVAMTLGPIDGGRGTRLDTEIDVAGAGFGVGLAALARQVIRAEAPVDGENLRRLLEG